MPGAPYAGALLQRCTCHCVPGGKRSHTGAELTKVKVRRKMPLNIQVKIHWESDNALGNAIEQLSNPWKMPKQVHVHLRDDDASKHNLDFNYTLSTCISISFIAMSPSIVPSTTTGIRRHTYKCFR